MLTFRKNWGVQWTWDIDPAKAQKRLAACHFFRHDGCSPRRPASAMPSEDYHPGNHPEVDVDSLEERASTVAGWMNASPGFEDVEGQLGWISVASWKG